MRRAAAGCVYTRRRVLYFSLPLRALNPPPHPRHQHDHLGDGVLILHSEHVLPLQIPRGAHALLAVDCVKFSSQMSPTYLRLSRRGGEGAADEGGGGRTSCRALIVEVGAGGGLDAVEEGFFLLGGAFVEAGWAVDSTMSRARRMTFLRRMGKGDVC